MQRQRTHQRPHQHHRQPQPQTTPQRDEQQEQIPQAETTFPEKVLDLQRTVGNRAVQTLAAQGMLPHGARPTGIPPVRGIAAQHAQRAEHDEGEAASEEHEGQPSAAQRTYGAPLPPGDPHGGTLQRQQAQSSSAQAAQSTSTASVASPGAATDRERETARQIRQFAPDGIMVLLSIPDAVALADVDTVERGEIDGYPWAATLERAAMNEHIQPYWARYRTANNITNLPEDYAGATSGQRGRIRALVYKPNAQGGFRDELRDAMWTHMPGTVRRIYYSNNHQFQRDADSLAREHHAVALNAAGQVRTDGFMIYSTPAQIGQHINAVHTAVLDLLRRTHQEGDPPDEQVARVGALGLFAHGTESWLGGHGAASGASFTRSGVAAIVTSMSPALAPNVRVHLFACSTGADRGGAAAGETSFADTFRDQLIAGGHAGAMVMGHTSSGSAMGNPDLRAFAGTGAGGADVVFGTSSFPDDYVDAELLRLGRVRAGRTPTAAQRRDIRLEMRRFYAVESWLFPAMGQPNPTRDALLRDFQAAWERRHPTPAPAATGG